MVAQAGGLFPWLTLRDNFAFGPRASRRSAAEVHAVVDDPLAATGSDGFAGALPAQLSGGMRQRAAIAQVLTYCAAEGRSSGSAGVCVASSVTGSGVGRGAGGIRT